MAARKHEAQGRPPRTESQPVTASRLPSLKTRSASQPAREKLQGNDEIFGIMVKRQMQMRKDLVQLRQVALPRLDGKPPPNHQEQAAQLIASMAEAVSNYGYMRRSKGEAVEMDSNHWPSLVQQAAAAAESAHQAETGPGDLRRGVSKSSLAEDHLTPFQSVVLERRREREAKAKARLEAEAEAEAAEVKEEAPDVRPPTPCYPSPFKEQPAPPPMPPEWSKGLWEQRKRELAEERRRREAHRDPFRQPSPPRVPEHGTHNAHVPPEDGPAPWRPWRCPIFPTWGRPAPEEVPEPEPRRVHRAEPRVRPEKGPGCGPMGPVGPDVQGPDGLAGPRHPGHPGGPGGPGGPGNARWNWGAGFFASGKVKPLTEAPSELVARRTRELIAHLEEEMARTRMLPLEERKKVFKDLQRRFHPDKNLMEEEAATLAFQHLMDSRHAYLTS